MPSRTKQVNVRVSVDDDSFVREMDGSWSEILKIGFEKWASEYPDFLMKRSQEYKELYSKCYTKYSKCYTKTIQKSNELEEIYKIYIATGRDVNNPTHQDRDWVKQKLSDIQNGSRVSVAQWFSFAQKRYTQDHQKKLEVSDD